MAGESWLLSLNKNLRRAASGRHGLSGLIKKDVRNTGTGTDGLCLNAVSKYWQNGGKRTKFGFNLDGYFT